MEAMENLTPECLKPNSSPRVSFKEALYAILILAGFLLLAVMGHYLTGRLLFTEVIWDPVGIYTFFPGNQVVIDAFQSGHFPLWDVTRGFGAPHITPSFGISDFPLKLPAYLLDSMAGWELYILLRFLCAGIFCFFMARELPLGFHGSMFAAVSYMLCGYFRVFHNLPDMNVALWFPLVMLCSVRCARRRSLFYFVATVVTASFLDNNPVSSFYAIIYLDLFYVLMDYSQGRNRRRPFRRIAEPVLIVSAMTLSGMLMDWESILPFMEYFSQSWNFHPPELGGLHIPISAGIALVTPVFDYWMAGTPNLSLENLEQLTLIPAYLGMVTSCLAVLAVARQRHLAIPGLFFTGAALVIAGVIFGIPPFTLLYHLPLVKGLQNFRYTQPYLAHAAAMLGGIGLEMVLSSSRARKQALVAAAVILAWIAGHAFIFRGELLSSNLVLFAMTGAVGAALIIIAGGTILWRRFPSRKGSIMAGLIILGAGLELALYFNLARPLFGPHAYKLNEPPAAEFMKEREDAPFRIWGLSQRIIHPNLAGLYGLIDIRDQSPVYVKNYALFMGRVNGWDTDRRMMHGFLEKGKFYFDLEWENVTDGLLDLVNVRYLLSRGRPGAKSLLDRATGYQITAPAHNYVTPSEITINGRFKKAIITHSPASMTQRLDNPELSGRAFAYAAVMPKALECPDHDGVFMTALKTGDETSRLIYTRFVEPRRQRSWLPFYWHEKGGGALALASLPGPKDSQKCDYAVWSEPDIMPAGSPGLSEHGLDKVYDREFRVYENRDAMARVFSVSRAVPARSLTSAVSNLLEKDPTETAFVQSLGKELSHLSAAKISAIREGPDRLSFRARCPDRCFAVVSNLYYPGWRAYSGEEEKRIFRTDGALQGMFLEKEDKKIKMRYEPVSFRIGWWVHAAWIFLFLLVTGLVYLRKR
ncbi:MAG: hypothetical protein R6V10_15355 [bacterium]